MEKLVINKKKKIVNFVKKIRHLFSGNVKNKSLKRLKPFSQYNKVK